MSTLSTPSVKVLVIDEILSYMRIKIDTPTPRITLQQQALNAWAKVTNIPVP